MNSAGGGFQGYNKNAAAFIPGQGFGDQMNPSLDSD
jgi:hypothetical protein